MGPRRSYQAHTDKELERWERPFRPTSFTGGETSGQYHARLALENIEKQIARRAANPQNTLPPPYCLDFLLEVVHSLERDMSLDELKDVWMVLRADTVHRFLGGIRDAKDEIVSEYRSPPQYGSSRRKSSDRRNVATPTPTGGQEVSDDIDLAEQSVPRRSLRNASKPSDTRLAVRTKPKPGRKSEDGAILKVGEPKKRAGGLQTSAAKRGLKG